MIRATGFSAGERTLHVHGWISIMWFASAVSVAGSQGVELETTSEVLARCGDNVTLTCNAISSQKLDIKSFAWSARNATVCPQDAGQPQPDVLCESTAASPHGLKVTLINVMPGRKGKYLCKLKSNVGAKSATTFLSVQDCLESSHSVIDSSHAECQFTGVYPRGTVHWFQGDDNLTDSASTQEEEDQHGRYNILSEIKFPKTAITECVKLSSYCWDLLGEQHPCCMHTCPVEEYTLRCSGCSFTLIPRHSSIRRHSPHTHDHYMYCI